MYLVVPFFFYFPFCDLQRLSNMKPYLMHIAQRNGDHIDVEVDILSRLAHDVHATYIHVHVSERSPVS